MTKIQAVTAQDGKSGFDTSSLWTGMPDGEVVLDLSRAPHRLNMFMVNVLTDFLDYDEVQSMGGRYPLFLLCENLEHIRDAGSLPHGVLSAPDAGEGEEEEENDGRQDQDPDPDQDQDQDQDQAAAILLFRDVLVRSEEGLRAARENFAKNIAQGVVSFSNLPMLLAAETRLIMNDDGLLWGGVLKKMTLHSSFTSRWYVLQIEILHAVKGELSTGTRTAYVESFRGQMALVDLPFTVVKESVDIPEAMFARGRRAMQFHVPGTIARYAGDMVQQAYWHDRRYRAHGRIVIDPVHFESMVPDGWRSALNSSGIEMEHDQNQHHHRRTSGKPATIQPCDADAWRVWPYLYGFSLANKQWGRFLVDGMSPVVWRQDAFEAMVMPERDKRVVHALVAHHGGGFQDIVDDKGGGLIFLLAGPPGEGKTLLAETVAEALKRPLYSVSVGQLGIEPGQLEQSLRDILDLATVWNAVILLDEADIFLEQRDSTSILRNAMVGVFLRLLEYHQGVLFLTTNRAENIDKAFYSRISVAINYPPSDDAKRARIWTNLLRAAGEDVEMAAGVVGHAMNGRQIKNCIRLGQTLARAAGEAKMKEEHLLEALDFSTRFSASSNGSAG